MTQGYEFQPPAQSFGMQGMPGAGPQMVQGAPPMPAYAPEPGGGVAGYAQHPKATGGQVPGYGEVQLNLGLDPMQAPAMSPEQQNAMALAGMRKQMESLVAQNAALAAQVQGQMAPPAQPQAPTMNPEERALRQRIAQIEAHNDQVRKVFAHVERMRDELIEYEQQASKKTLMPVEPLRRKLWNMIHGTMEGYDGQQEQTAGGRVRAGTAAGGGTAEGHGIRPGDPGDGTSGQPGTIGQAGRDQHGLERAEPATGRAEGAGGGGSDLAGDTPGQHQGGQPHVEAGHGAMESTGNRPGVGPIGGLPLGPDPGLTEPDPGLETDIEAYADMPPDPDEAFSAPEKDLDGGEG